MSDVLFRFLLMARRRDRSRLRRFFLRDEQLLAAGVEQLVETAAARIEVHSQHEEVSRETTTVPASVRHRVQFFDVARPDRPAAGSFDNRSQKFPLEPTLRVFTCPTCRGRGEVRCGRCSGRGRARCGRCRGSGWDASNRRLRCATCGGGGETVCSRCRGAGDVTCGRCRGEGELATWEVEIYRWWTKQRSGEEHPDANASIRRAFGRWLKIDRDLVADLEPATAARHLGYQSPEALEVTARAEELRLRLEAQARQDQSGPGQRFLHLRSDCSLAPVAYTVVRLKTRARYYWLVGRGERAVEVGPMGNPDGGKLLGWLGLGSGGALSAEALLRAFESAGTQSLELLAGMPDLGLAGGTAASGILVLSGIRRLLRRRPPVLTVGLLPVTGQPTAWLTCLAYLGSYTQRLWVLDRAYDTQMERLAGKMRPERQSESLTVELADGRKVRLVEVARPDSLTAGQLRLMLQALDAVMIIEEQDRPADELASRLRSLALPATIGTVAVDRSPSVELERDPGGPPPPPGGTFSARSDPPRLRRGGGRRPRLERGLPPPLAAVRRSPDRGRQPTAGQPNHEPVEETARPARPRHRRPPAQGADPRGRGERQELADPHPRPVHLAPSDGERVDERPQPVRRLPELRRRRPAAAGDHPLGEVRAATSPGCRSPGAAPPTSTSCCRRRTSRGSTSAILVDELRKNPNLSAWKAGKSRAILTRFTQLLTSCDGFVFIIDLVRDSDPEAFASAPRKLIGAAFADQINPIMTGILMATKMNAEMAMKPVFFVFSKPDLHRLPPAEVRKHFERGLAIPLGQLRRKLMNVRHYNVQCAGWKIDSALDGLGVDVLISDLAHAVHAGTSR